MLLDDVVVPLLPDDVVVTVEALLPPPHAKSGPAAAVARTAAPIPIALRLLIVTNELSPRPLIAFSISYQ
jgi:hypothetical protein